MALALYDALQGIRKLSQFIDPSPWNSTQFAMMTFDEINEMFDELEKIYERMDTANIHRAMSD